MDQNYNIYIKSLSGDPLKIVIQGQTKISDIKTMVRDKKYKEQDTKQFKLMLQGKELKDVDRAQDLNLKQGDQLILMISSIKTKTLTSQTQFVHPLNKQSLETGEEFKKAVEDLVQLGFKREDVILALRQCDRDLKNTLKKLINRDAKIYLGPGTELDEEEQDTKEEENQQNLINMKILALKESPLVQKLVDSVKGNPELWISTLQQMQQTNPNLYNDIADNIDVFFELLNQRIEEKNVIQEEHYTINQDDALIITQIQEVYPSMPQDQIIKEFIKNNKNPHSTILQISCIKNT